MHITKTLNTKTIGLKCTQRDISSDIMFSLFNKTSYFGAKGAEILFCITEYDSAIGAPSQIYIVSITKYILDFIFIHI